MKDALKGKYFIDYRFDFEVHNLIPDVSILEAYVPTDTYVRLLETWYDILSRTAKEQNEGKYILPLINNFCLFGDPSSGKTVMLQALCASLHIP